MRTRRTLALSMSVLSAAFPKTDCAFSNGACAKMEIPLRSGPVSKYFQATNSWLSLDASGTLEAEISLRNLTARSLSFEMVIVNYLDENGRNVFSMPFEARLPGTTEELHNVRPFSILQIHEPVGPGGEITLTGRNLLSTTRMPVSAEIVYWQASFSDDGSSVNSHFGQLGFRTDPVLVETPGYLQFSMRHPAERVELSAKLQINEYGRVLGIQPGREGGLALSPSQLAELSPQLARWRFYPAVENGYAVSSQLYLIFAFLPESPLPTERCFLGQSNDYPKLFVLVNMQPLPNSTNWIAYYGGFPANGKMERNIIELSAPVTGTLVEQKDKK